MEEENKITMMDVHHIQKALRENKIEEALIETSAALERFLFQKISIEGGINPELMSGWGLGKLLYWTEKLFLIVDCLDKKSMKSFKNFKELRNFFVHNGFYNMQDKEIRKISKEIIKETIEGLRKIYFRNEPIAEEAYRKYIEKTKKKMKKFLGEKKAIDSK